jgi:SAM-dependent methyltransferase
VDELEGRNRAIYEDPNVASHYGQADELQRPETVILERIADQVRDQPVLDIGIGGGRTVAPLRALASRYVGLDYSEAMVAVAHQLHPDADIRVGDVRDLFAFGDGSFPFVVFSFNGIDSISHEDRLVALAEIRRVVEPGGLFVFSSHNDAYRPTFRKLWLDDIHLGRRPVPALLRLLLATPRLARRVRNHLQIRRHAYRTGTYAIRCDGGHDHTALTYYISRASQVEQLRSAGFATEAVYDFHGDEASDDCADAWLYYLTRAEPADAPTLS